MSDSQTAPFSDEELCTKIQKQGNDSLEQLLYRYLPLVQGRANALGHGGRDREDLIQEGLIGLLNAINNYDITQGATFKTFAYRCVTNKMLSWIERGKNSTATLNIDEVTLPLNEKDDPSFIVIDGITPQGRFSSDSSLLSPTEKEILKLYLSGYSYQEMAASLQSTTKAVDNALQRARKKLRFSAATNS